jgi:AcrR family transcriptional regulator
MLRPGRLALKQALCSTGSATMPRTRKPLSAERIAQAALALVDKEGLEGFSFRVLAKKLGCEAMSIYHYYPSKAHLFDAMVEICIAETQVPPAGVPWKERLQDLAHAYRATALRHPGFFLYFAIYRMNNRAGLSFLDRIAGIFQETGLPPEWQAAHFRAIGYYIMGAGLDEAQGYIKGPSATEPVPETKARMDYPAITSLGRYFSKAHHEATFEHGLEALLDALERDVKSRKSEDAA